MVFILGQSPGSKESTLKYVHLSIRYSQDHAYGIWRHKVLGKDNNNNNETEIFNKGLIGLPGPYLLTSINFNPSMDK